MLALLTVAVAAAIGFATAAYNLAPVTGNAEFGTANHSFVLEDPDPDSLQPVVAAGEEDFGAVDAIGHRAVAVPGSVDTLDYRAQDPDGPYGSPLLDLRDGRYPASDDEIAVTDGVADTFDAGIGAMFALDGVERTVVGVVENPSDLDDEFALLPPSALGASESVTMLVDASQAQVESFWPPGDVEGIGHVMISRRGDLAEDVVAAVSVLTVAAVALFLVSLVAAASFVVIAQRRLRQLGMLAAVGATEKQIRLVMVANGAVAGAVAAVLGAVVGVAGWIAVSPRVEEAVGYRVDAFNVPWWLLAAGGLLAVVTAAGAAWWPARTMARIPPVLALSGRPPRPSPAHRSAALAGFFIVGGVACPGPRRRRGRHHRRHQPEVEQRPAGRRRHVGRRHRGAARQPVGDPATGQRRHQAADRRAAGAARPRALPGPLRGRPRRDQPRPRDPRRRRRHRRRRRAHRRRRQPVGPSAAGRPGRRGTWPAAARARRRPTSPTCKPASTELPHRSTTRP